MLGVLIMNQVSSTYKMPRSHLMLGYTQHWTLTVSIKILLRSVSMIHHILMFAVLIHNSYIDL
jgi:hypothetical protein